MEVFRISAAKYATGLTSSGSANRWNEDGQFVIYAGSSRSLSSLELIVHRSYIQPLNKYKVMVIHLKDEDHLFTTIKTSDLPKDWRTVSAYAKLQAIGSEWYNSQSSLVLKVPSAVIPQEYNYVINTRHKDFGKKAKLVDVEDFFWDARVL